MKIVKKNFKAKIVLIVCIVIACFSCIYAAWSIWTEIRSQHTVYNDFDKKRISEIEDTFGITIDDDVELEEYHKNLASEIGIHDLTMVEMVVNDYQKFMENNILSETDDYEEYFFNGKLQVRFEYDLNNDKRFGVSVEQINNKEYKIGIFGPLKLSEEETSAPDRKSIYNENYEF